MLDGPLYGSNICPIRLCFSDWVAQWVLILRRGPEAEETFHVAQAVVQSVLPPTTPWIQLVLQRQIGEMRGACDKPCLENHGVSY